MASINVSTVFCITHFSLPSRTKTIKNTASLNAEGIEPKALKASKVLLDDNKAFRRISNADQQTGMALSGLYVASVGRSINLLPVALVPRAQEILEKAFEERHGYPHDWLEDVKAAGFDENTCPHHYGRCPHKPRTLSLVEEFLYEYPSIREKARVSLGAFFRESDFPNEEAIRSRFSMSWRFTAFDTPSSLADISQSLYESERKKAEQNAQDLLAEARQGLCDGFTEMIETMQGILTGERRVFDATIRQFNEFLHVFDAKNIGGDNTLKTLADKARVLMASITADDLRTIKDPKTKKTVDVNPSAKQKLSDGFRGIAETLAGITEAAPSRLFSASDWEE